MMNIAIFADVHGRVELCFRLCSRWEEENKESIDLILQAGDLGAFPDPDELDKATKRYAENDPSELGFSASFVHPSADTTAVLQRVQSPLVFVRGNHEDHRWLDKLEEQATGVTFPIDCYQRVFCLKSGMPFQFQRGAEAITIVGIGRIGAPVGELESHKPKYVQGYELERIYQIEDSAFDLLLTHDSARDDVISGSGMDEIRYLLDHIRPSYHFFGHYGGPCRLGIDENGYTISCKLADLHWDRATSGKVLEAGSMGLLRWKNASEHHFEVVTSPWLQEYTAHTWQHL
jgi:Calcineurin-like phosphoesterase